MWLEILLDIFFLKNASRSQFIMLNKANTLEPIEAVCLIIFYFGGTSGWVHHKPTWFITLVIRKYCMIVYRIQLGPRCNAVSVDNHVYIQYFFSLTKNIHFLIFQTLFCINNLITSFPQCLNYEHWCTMHISYVSNTVGVK